MSSASTSAQSLGLKPIVVPANSSRFLPSAAEAQRQETATIDLAWDESDPYVFNAAFDESKIRHDDSYCTSVVDLSEKIQVPTLTYLSDAVLPHFSETPQVVDIGCGQGELVHRLRTSGLPATGYDPVLREPGEGLHDRYWTGDEPPADLYVMRCVLPHISRPWEFIAEISTSNADALVLIEFQAREWITGQSIWYQLSHDHVNVFSTEDFASRFDVVAHGTFSSDEWEWVLIRAGSFRPAPPQRCPVAGEFLALEQARRSTLTKAAQLGPVHIWGAAGKGIVLAHALSEAGVDIPFAIDADPRRWGLFMEVSGVPIVSPAVAQDLLPDDALILVCNPNHLDAVRKISRRSWRVVLPSSLG